MADPIQTEQPPAQEPVRVNGTKPTPATNADLSPQQRWLNDKAAADRADPWLDGDRVLTRNKAGELVQHEKKIGADGEPTIGKLLSDEPGADDGVKPTGEDKIKVADIEISHAELRELMAHKAETDLRKAQVPATPDGYKLELPKDLKLPAGVDFKLASLDDPAKGPGLRTAMAWAHAQGLSQEQFSSMLGTYAAATSQENIALANAARAERDKMGVTGGTRVDAISRWLTAHYGEAARPMIQTLVTSAQVEIWETVIGKLTNQGGGFSARGRDMDSQTISAEDYEKLSYHGRKEYAQQMTDRANGSGRR